MFKKLFASMGMGSAEVDTKLHQQQVMPGTMLTGDVHIKGGSAKQEIEDLSLFLMTRVEVESGDTEYKQDRKIQTVPLARNFMVQAKETIVIPFQMFVHPETPITEFPAGMPQAMPSYQSMGKGGPAHTPAPAAYGSAVKSRGCQVWVHTGLAIDKGVDSSDKDSLTIVPPPHVTHFLNGISQLGFQLHSADVEHGTLRGNGFQSTIGFYQEIEYKPIPGSRYASTINELEVSFVIRQNDTGVLMEFDKRFHNHDSYKSMIIKHNDYQNVNWAEKIASLLGWKY